MQPRNRMWPLGAFTALLVSIGSVPATAQDSSSEATKATESAGTPEAAEETLPEGAVARLRTSGMKLAPQVGHLLFTSNGKKLISAGKYSNACVWDASTGKLLQELTGHKGGVGSMSLAADDGTLVTADDEGVRVWDLGNGKQLCKIEIKDLTQPLVSIAADGKRIAIGGPKSATIEIYDIQGKHLEEWKSEKVKYGVHALRFAPDGKTLISMNCQAIKGKVDGRFGLWVWDAANGELLRDLNENEELRIPRQLENPGSMISFSPKSDQVALLAGDRNNEIRVWTVSDGKIILNKRDPNVSAHAIAIAFDGSAIALVKDKETLTIFESKLDKTRSSVRVGRGTLSVAFSPDGKTLATGHMDGAVRLWDAKTGKSRTVRMGRARQVVALGWTSDGEEVVALGGDRKTQTFAADGKAGRVIHEHEGAPVGLKTNSKGELIAIELAGGRIVLVNPRTGKPVGSTNVESVGIGLIEVSPDLSRIAFEADGGEFAIAELGAEEAARVAPDRNRHRRGRRFQLDARWQSADRRQVRPIPFLESGWRNVEVHALPKPLLQHAGRLSPDGRSLAFQFYGGDLQAAGNKHPAGAEFDFHQARRGSVPGVLRRRPVPRGRPSIGGSPGLGLSSWPVATSLSCEHQRNRLPGFFARPTAAGRRRRRRPGDDLESAAAPRSQARLDPVGRGGLGGRLEKTCRPERLGGVDGHAGTNQRPRPRDPIS